MHDVPMPDEAMSERLNIPLPKSLLDAIDEWRRRQQVIPSRAEAARKLIEQGLGKSAFGGAGAKNV